VVHCSALGYWHHLVVSSVDDVSEIHSANIYRTSFGGVGE
jgi:hypothetical protein